VHDTVEKTWRHLDFFEHQAYLVARVPRAECGEHGVHLVAVPWARPGSGFTVLMEVAMFTFAKQMTIVPLAVMAREHNTRVWRVIENYVNATRADLDFSGVTQVSCDDTSARRGQDYVSLFMDLAQRRVMFATPGRDASTVKAFAEDLTAHGGPPKTQVEQVCCDMSPAFISGIGQHLCEQPDETPAEDETNVSDVELELNNAAAGATAARVATCSTRCAAPVELHRPQIVFDRYHVVARANEAVDEVRRVESKVRPKLKRTRYVWLKNEANLTAKQRETLTWLTRPSMQLKSTRDPAAQRLQRALRAVEP
jgi:transposase